MPPLALPLNPPGAAATPVPRATPAGAALWVSIFEPAFYLLTEGPDAGDRALGALAAAVVVTGQSGWPDAYYVAEMAMTVGRAVFFPRAVAACWRGRRLEGAGVCIGRSQERILALLGPLLGEG